MELISLAKFKKKQIGIICKIDESLLPKASGLAQGEIEAQLLEMGFIEGARVEVLHLGLVGGDPIAVRINNSNTVIALRKNEASIILLEKLV